MKILLISCSDYRYDGRLRELVTVFSQIGELSLITEGDKPIHANHKIVSGNYLTFIREAIQFGKRLSPLDMLVLDNRKSVIPGLYLSHLLRPIRVVQDCRELYLSKELHHLSGKIGCLIERRGIRRADVIICANQERADFMKEYYHLPQRPLVYENLRSLAYESNYCPEKDPVLQEIKSVLLSNEVRLVSTSGCSISRGNDVLVRSLKRVKSPCRLFLVGGGSADDQGKIREIIAEEHLEDRVNILEMLNQNQLKALLSLCHIGIVNYHQKDFNNKFCASGKIFEFVYEGLPVVTTTNPPLSRICEDNGIGCADDSYADGINEVIAGYASFQANVQRFAETHPVAQNNGLLVKALKTRLNLPLGAEGGIA